MSDNWIVQNLNSALSTWSEKMAELWTLLTENPATFKGGGIWRIMTNINDALTAIAYGLLVLFFAAGIIKTCGSFTDLKKPEHVLKAFIRFALAQGAITYGMELMIMKYDKMVAITQAESQRKMNIAKNTISDMLKNMERITVAELVKRTGLSRGFFYKNELIRREMDDAIHRQEAIFKNRHPVAMDRKLENSVIELKIELLKAKAENEKLAEQNQELKRKNELLQQELEKLNKRVSRKEISVLKKL